LNGGGLPVWTYWEGPCPPYIALCLETLRRHAGARVLDRASFDDLWTSDRDLPIDELYVAHRADFVRAYLMRHHGGFWIDADCILLRPVAPLASLLERCDLVTYREPAGSITNNFLLARAGAPVVADFYSRVTAHVRARRPIDWLEIGSVPLTAAIEAHPGSTELVPAERIMPICWSDARRFLDELPPEPRGDGGADFRSMLRPDVYGYMLSNHSMPARIKEAGRAEVLCSPTLLGHLLREGLSGDPTMSNQPPNYAYWQQSGREWSSEYDRRKTRHPFYHIAEMMIADYAAHHAPCRVLELGCGTGRHLFNLSRIEGVDVHGFDQSPSMVEGGFGWASPEWRAAHVTVGLPTGELPYPDGHFDIVYTSEALLHTRPEDLRGRLAELLRICRGHVLHLESTPGWSGYSPWHNGCWGHDFVTAYKDLGRTCEVLPSGFTRQAPYRVVVRPESVRWTWQPAMLGIYRKMEEQIEDGFQRAGAPGYA
jgi:SAM-dependent methyltransferase